MNNKFQNLPPNKRFNLSLRDSSLPAKKQKESQHKSPDSGTGYCLPAKKRICALNPNLPDKPFSSFDSNLDFGAGYYLPAKKRICTLNPNLLPDKPFSSFDINLDSGAGTGGYCLPAKKRIGGLNPNLIPDKPFSPFDLNLEYDPKSDQFQDHDHDHENDDDVLCAVCQSTDGDPSDPIVFCDGCDLTVHTTCYGNPLTKGVPEGDWFCSQCKTTKKNKNLSLSCCLCPNNGGALKPTTKDGLWAHIVCALFIPEVFFSDPEGREGIDCSKILKKRWGKKCYICEKSNGCVIGCSEEKCCLDFHVTCGLEQDLCMEYKEGRNKGVIVAGFCKSHTDLWMKQQATGKYKIVARNEE